MGKKLALKLSISNLTRLNRCTDFFLWGHMKQLGYETVVETEEDLIARITVGAGTIADMPAIFERTQ